MKPIHSAVRRTAEIELALITDYLYYQKKSMPSVVNYLKACATVLDISDFDLIETAIINYKKIMPNANEITAISDFAKSRSKFINSTIINNKLSRKTFYKVLSMTDNDLGLVLCPKLKFIFSDAIIKFLEKMFKLHKDIADIKLNCYTFDEEGNIIYDA